MLADLQYACAGVSLKRGHEAAAAGGGDVSVRGVGRWWWSKASHAAPV